LLFYKYHLHQLLDHNTARNLVLAEYVGEKGIVWKKGLDEWLVWFGFYAGFGRKSSRAKQQLLKIYFSRPTFLCVDDKFPHCFAKVFFGSGLSFGM
jgi:hypothetical protein